jgi:hypothetical protein
MAGSSPISSVNSRTALDTESGEISDSSARLEVAAPASASVRPRCLISSDWNVPKLARRRRVRRRSS